MWNKPRKTSLVDNDYHIWTTVWGFPLLHTEFSRLGKQATLGCLVSHVWRLPGASKHTSLLFCVGKTTFSIGTIFMAWCGHYCVQTFQFLLWCFAASSGLPLLLFWWIPFLYPSLWGCLWSSHSSVLIKQFFLARFLNWWSQNRKQKRICFNLIWCILSSCYSFQCWEQRDRICDAGSQSGCALICWLQDVFILLQEIGQTGNRLKSSCYHWCKQANHCWVTVMFYVLKLRFISYYARPISDIWQCGITSCSCLLVVFCSGRPHCQKSTGLRQS